MSHTKSYKKKKEFSIIQIDNMGEMYMKNENSNEGKKSGRSHSLKLISIGFMIGVVLSVILVLVGHQTISDFLTKGIINFPEFGAISNNSTEPVITIDYVNKKLENISDLSTAEMTYNGLFTVAEGNIPFITKKGFSMIYTASVKAGIDASLVKTEVTGEKIIVILPATEIQMSWVDPESIQFYDEKHALFNWGEKTDVTAAIAAAEKDVKEKANTDGLLKRASQQAEYIVRGLLVDSAGNREIVIIHGNVL